MNKALSYAIWGFAFGAVGLYVLAALSLVSPVFETLSSPLMYPGRVAATFIAGTDGSNAEVALLTLFNGVLYAFTFGLIGSAIRRPA